MSICYTDSIQQEIKEERKEKERKEKRKKLLRTNKWRENTAN